MKHGSLFSGIGGFDLAAEWMGWENKFHCEWNPFGQKVLKHYWPDAELFSDITKSDFTKYEGTIDIISGGFPCQPYSTAGLRRGKEDDRHLWPEMCRAIREIKPRWVVGENVRGLISWNGGVVFDEVQADLEAEGYEVQSFLLPACGVNAPHRRDRIWFVAYSNNKGGGAGLRQIQGENGEISQRNNYAEFSNTSDGDATNAIGGRYHPTKWENFPTQAPICFGDDGLSSRLDSITFSKWRSESIKAGGNAIVPQVVYQIFKAIEQYDTRTQEKD